MFNSKRLERIEDMIENLELRVNRIPDETLNLLINAKISSVEIDSLSDVRMLSFDPVKCGIRFRELRMKTELTQEDLASLSGLSYSTILRVESGTKCRIKTYATVARALGGDIVELLYGDGGQQCK